MRTAIELARIAKADRPNVRYAINAKSNAIAAWDSGRWITVAAPAGDTGNEQPN